jgi:DNA-3-methyladenine glycosylase
LSCSGNRLERAFFDRPAPELARRLLGKILRHRGVCGWIVETEAYLGLQDAASHAYRGLTPRTRVLFGHPGHAYVYLIYGIYECLNVVAEPEGSPGCVLIRALEPLDGLDAMRQRRPAARRDEDLTSGPAKLALALGVTRLQNGADLTRGELTISAPAAERQFEVGISPRIGIRHNADWPLRFFIQGNRFVSGAIRAGKQPVRR